jgi:hypothetical protein
MEIQYNQILKSQDKREFWKQQEKSNHKFLSRKLASQERVDGIYKVLKACKQMTNLPTKNMIPSKAVLQKWRRGLKHSSRVGASVWKWRRARTSPDTQEIKDSITHLSYKKYKTEFCKLKWKDATNLKTWKYETHHKDKNIKLRIIL